MITLALVLVLVLAGAPPSSAAVVELAATPASLLGVLAQLSSSTDDALVTLAAGYYGVACSGRRLELTPQQRRAGRSVAISGPVRSPPSPLATPRFSNEICSAMYYVDILAAAACPYARFLFLLATPALLNGIFAWPTALVAAARPAERHCNVQLH